MSRQTERQLYRQDAQRLRTEQRKRAKSAARRALLERQTRREKSGFYEGCSVATALLRSSHLPRTTARSIRKGQFGGRIICTRVGIFGRSLELHATKGWRSYQAGV